MRRWIAWALCAATLAGTGCLFVDRIEYRMRINDDGDLEQMVVRYVGLSSDAENEEELAADFVDLTEIWRGDEHAAERRREGLVVLDRQLFVEDGKLSGTEKLEPVANALPEVMTEMRATDTMRVLRIENTTDAVVDSNGKIEKLAEGYDIAWPLDERELWFIQATDRGEIPADRIAANAAELVKRFEAKFGDEGAQTPEKE